MPENQERQQDQGRSQQASGRATGESGQGKAEAQAEAIPPTQQISQSAEDLVSGGTELLKQAEELLRIQAEQRPYAVLGAALGVGYVLGGGVPAFAMRMLVNSGMRMAVGAVVGAVLEKKGAIG
jgi:ElaB/YqjD/DUF883 family membrane-anchored ribosome-binding protein